MGIFPSGIQLKTGQKNVLTKGFTLEARAAMAVYIHDYNFKRCHSAIDNKTPASVYYPVMLLPYAMEMAA